MAERIPYSKEDSWHMVEWLVRHHPQKAGRMGNSIWQQLVDSEDARPWASRHSWQSWRSHYKSSETHYDMLISKRANRETVNRTAQETVPEQVQSTSQKGGATPRNEPLPSRNEAQTPTPRGNENRTEQRVTEQSGETETIKRLARYFIRKEIEDGNSLRASDFKELCLNPKAGSWVKSRSAIQWRDFYEANKAPIVRKMNELSGTTIDPSSPPKVRETPVVKFNGKRKRVQTREQSSDDDEDLSNTTLRRLKRRRTDPSSKNANGTLDKETEDGPSDTEAPNQAPVVNGVETDNIPRPAAESRMKQSTPVLDRRLKVIAPETPISAQEVNSHNDTRPRETTTSPATKRADYPSPISPIEPQLPESDPQHATPRNEPGAENLKPNIDPSKEPNSPQTSVLPSSLAKKVSAAQRAFANLGPNWYGLENSPISLPTKPRVEESPEAQEAQEHPAPYISNLGGLLTINGRVPALRIFPISLPSLTPNLRAAKAAVKPLEPAIPETVVEEVGAPETHNSRGEGDTSMLEEAEVEQNLTQGIPKDGEKAVRTTATTQPQQARIFPHTLPQLTPALRPGPLGERNYIIDDEKVTYLTKEVNEKDITRERGLFPRQLPSLTPTLRRDSQGRGEYIINDNNIRFLQREDSPNGVVESNEEIDELDEDELDEDELEGPSPMPNLGSDKNSSYSFAISDEDDGTVAAPTKPVDNSHRVETPTAPVELAAHGGNNKENGGVEPGATRYLVPRKRPRRPSQSSLFESASSEPEEPLPTKAHQESKKVGKSTTHYPVTFKSTAQGLVRERMGRPGPAPATKATKSSRPSEVGAQRASKEGKEASSKVHEKKASIPYELDVEEVEAPDKENVAPVLRADEAKDTPQFHVPTKFPAMSSKSPPSPEVLARSIKQDRAAGHHPKQGLDRGARAPFTVQPLSKTIGLTHQDPSRSVPTFYLREGRDAALAYPSPHISSDMERSRRAMEEPSPLARILEKARDKGKGRASLSNENDLLAMHDKSKPGKVRFDGVVIDRDRRKTTGSIGVSLSTTRPDLFTGQAGSSRPHEMPTKAGPSTRGVIPDARSSPSRTAAVNNLEEAGEEDESPLARYSVKAMSSPPRSSQKPRSSMPGGSAAPRMTHTLRRSASQDDLVGLSHLPSLPSPVQVPILPSSSPRRPGEASRMRTIHLAGMDIGTAQWSPFRFKGPLSKLLNASMGAAQGQPSRLAKQAASSSRLPFTLQANSPLKTPLINSSPESPDNDDEEMAIDGEEGEITVPSIDYRDQRRDAEWVSANKGRRTITSEEVPSRRRSAPIPSPGDRVVYSSSSSPAAPASRSRARRRTMEPADYDVSLVSAQDRDRVAGILRLEEQEPNFETDPDALWEGLGEAFETLSSHFGFDESISRKVWAQCGDLKGTLEILRAMKAAAEAAGKKHLQEQRERKLQEEQRRRERLLTTKMDERSQSRRRQSASRSMSRDATSFLTALDNDRRSIWVEDDDGDDNEDDGENDQEDEIRGRRRHRERSRTGTRQPRPPSFVPAEALSSLFG
ncbi:hypothetical protein CPB86DRAFT_782415 [Serendipita vermifera]|nr:hypothetical protein CPB86DRAFT_782415 [Serendipita vermifera]